MERKERNFAFKHYEVLNKMSCVAGLEDLRTDKPLIIQTRPNLTQTQSCPKPKYAPKTKADHVSEIFAALQYFGQTILRQVLCMTRP